MRLLLLLPALTLLSVSTKECTKKKDVIYKGRLEVKALCMNYTVSVVEGNIKPSLVEASWTDPGTNKTYTNAFRLGSPCNFPQTINQGDEFYFTINTAGAGGDCAVCMAYYPTPSKKLSIRVVSK